MIDALINDYKRLFDESPIPYQCLDVEGNILLVNREWLEELGYSQDEVVGKWFGDFLIPEQRQLFEDEFESFKQQGKVRGIEFEMVRKDGKTIQVSYDGDVIYDKQGNFLNTQCMFVDITKRIELETNLESRVEELRKMNKMMIDRELKMVELKKRIEELEDRKL